MERIQVDTAAGEYGWITRHADLVSRYVACRSVDVWCPPAEMRASAVRYPVIYLHDGQNLFDPATSFIGVDWGIIAAMTFLMKAAGYPGAILVGVWNTARRWQEYMPCKPLLESTGRSLRNRFIQQFGGDPLSDQYLKFIVEELKPWIDATYPTLVGASHTFVMGSSMGALVSLYALTEYPDVFCGAGCLSTHWPIGGQTLLNYFNKTLPKPGFHKLYFDHGTEMLDKDYAPYQIIMNDFLSVLGYRLGHDWFMREFKGAEHSERAWRARIHIPLAFLLGVGDDFY